MTTNQKTRRSENRPKATVPATLTSVLGLLGLGGCGGGSGDGRDTGLNVSKETNALVLRNQVAEYRDPENAITYAFAKAQAITYFDFNGDSLPEVLTFPSNFTENTSIDIGVYRGGESGFSHSTTLLTEYRPLEFVRDTIVADFNGDGREDVILVDQGWELNDRDPNFFFGGYLSLFLGDGERLNFVSDNDWLVDTNTKSFNHIGTHGDIDGDGDIDFAIASFGDGLRVFLNNGATVFDELSRAELGVYEDWQGPSSVAHIVLGNEPKLIASDYRTWDPADPADLPLVIGYQDGEFVREGSLEKPYSSSTVFMNYGAADAYAQDLNNDGRDDFILIWETENTNNGIVDEWSDTSGDPQGNRYDSIGLTDTVVSIYHQTNDGQLVLNSTLPIAAIGTPQLGFNDFNGDGYLDFCTHSFGITNTNIHEAIWINDGSGRFKNPDPLNITWPYESWKTVTGFFIDHDNDGDMDFAGLDGIFPNPPTRTTGENLLVWENQGLEFTFDQWQERDILITMADFFGNA
jgi:hypothetical protein